MFVLNRLDADFRMVFVAQDASDAVQCRGPGARAAAAGAFVTDNQDIVVEFKNFNVAAVGLLPYRQMVLSFPIPLRYWMQANCKLFAKAHRRVNLNPRLRVLLVDGVYPRSSTKGPFSRRSL